MAYVISINIEQTFEFEIERTNNHALTDLVKISELAPENYYEDIYIYIIIL